MKKLAPSFSRSRAVGLGLLLSLLAHHAGAATSYYWDINGITAGAGGATPAGSWEGANWSTDSTGVSTTGNWVDGGFPRFAAGTDATGSYTVTANANHTIAGAFLSTGSGTVTIAGTGALSIDPTGGPQQGFFGQSGFLKFTCKLTGAGGIVGSSGQITLEGNNDYSGGTTPGGGLINFNNGNSLGTGPIIMSASGGALICEGTSAITIPNNWTISLATATVNCVGNTAGITYSGNVALGANTFNIGCGGNVANIDLFSGIISGTGGIGRSPGQSPAGIVKFTGANTYTGKTTLQSGITYATVLNSVTTPAQQASGSFGVPANAANGTLSIGATTVAATLVYVGAGETTDRVIDLAGTTGGATIQNDGTGPLTFTSANTASGVGAKTLTLQGASASAGTLSGAIVDSSSGATALTKAQAGKWVLGGANTYSGATAVNAGTLAQGAANVIPSGSGKGTFTVASGATFDLGGFNSTLNNLASAGTFDNATGGGAPTLTIGANNTGVTLSGVIKNTTGTLALTKIGTGAMTLSGANTYSGKTTVSAGTLNISSDGNLGTAPGSYVADQLTLNGGTIAFTATAVDIPANRGVTLGASGGTLSVSANQSPFIESIIAGSGSLTKSSSGNINLDGANTFSGGLTITGGGVRFNNNSAAGTGTITVTPASIITLRQLNPPGPTSVTINNPVVLNANNGNDIDLTGATGNTFTLAGPISGPGYLTISRGGTLGTIVLSGNNTYVGPTTVNAGTLQLGSSTALGGGYPNPILINTPAAVAGGFLYPAQVNSAGILDLNAQTVGYSISLNGGQLINNNASPAAVNGSPSGGVKVVFSNAGTGIAAGSTVNITGGGGSGAAASISSLGLTTASFTLSSGGSGYSGTLPTVAISGGGGSGATASLSRGVTAASFTITGGTTTYSVAPTVAITGGGGSGATATATLNGSGVVNGITIVNPGSAFTTAPAIAFSGGTVLVAGTNPSGTGNANNFTVVSVTVTAAGTGYGSAPTMAFTGANTTPATATGNANNFTIISINTSAAGSGYTSTPSVSLSSGSGYTLQAIVVNDITLLANSTIGGSGDTTVSEPIIGGFGLTKSGAGKVTLNAANSYSGATTVSAGMLLVNSPGSLAGGAVGVSSGATLGGTGTIGGLVTVSSGGTLSPGAPLGALTLTVAPSLGGTTAMDINKAAGPVLSSDKLVVSPGGGTLVYGGILAITSSGLPLVNGDTFTLFSAGSYAGSFSAITPATPGPGLVWDTSRLTVDGTLKVVCDGTLAASAGTSQTTCYGASITLGGTPTATGGSGSGYAYLWSPSTGLSSATAPNPTASPATTTAYTVTVTDANGCMVASSPVSVTIDNAAPAISSQPADQTVCGGSTASFSVTASGLSPSYSWSRKSNAGWGSAWATSGSGTTFRSSSSDNNSGDPNCNSFSGTGDVNSPSGNALGMYGGAGGDEVATRAFSPLASGQVVSIDFDNGNVDTGARVGFSLQTSGGADVLQFYFLGGQANYKYNDGTEQDTGLGFLRTGLRVQFRLTSSTTYALSVTPCGGAPSFFSGSCSGAIAQLKLFNQNTSGGADHNVYWNNFIVGGYVDNADNYSGDYAGQDKGDQPITVGNGGSTYTTPVLSTADNGSQYQVVVSSCGGATLSSAATLTVNARPTAAVSGDATTCPNVATTIQAALTGTGPWELTWSDGVQQHAVTSNPATRSVTPAAPTVYTLTALSDANCTAQPADLTGGATITAQDVVPPVLTLNGANPQTVECHGTFVELGATASDDCAGNLTAAIVTDNSAVNPNSVGSYDETYTVTDGYHSVTMHRTVNVVDTTPPSVTAGTIAACYTTLNDAQAAALAATTIHDACDSSPTVVVSTVGTCSAVITVTATDASGNHASAIYNTRVVAPPVLGAITATQGAANVKNCASTTVQGTVNISVTASDGCGFNGGHPDVALVNGAATDTATYDNESPPGTFNYHWDVTALTVDGTWTVTVTAADSCQAVVSQFLLCMDNAQLSGQVQLEGFVGTGTVPLHTRQVTFVATDGPGDSANVLKTWTLALSNVGGDTFAYSISDAPRGTRGLSAVTAWNLRSKLPITLDSNGQAAGVDFTGTKVLRGGDFDGSNLTSFDDYSILQSDFFSFNPVPDITGDGQVDFDDYAIFAGNWQLTGDPE